MSIPAHMRSEREKTAALASIHCGLSHNFHKPSTLRKLRIAWGFSAGSHMLVEIGARCARLEKPGCGSKQAGFAGKSVLLASNLAKKAKYADMRGVFQSKFPGSGSVTHPFKCFLEVRLVIASRNGIPHPDAPKRGKTRIAAGESPVIRLCRKADE